MPRASWVVGICKVRAGFSRSSKLTADHPLRSTVPCTVWRKAPQDRFWWTATRWAYSSISVWQAPDRPFVLPDASITSLKPFMDPDRRDAADEAVVCLFVGLHLDPIAFFAGRAGRRLDSLDQPPRQGKAMGRESLGLDCVRWAGRSSGARPLRSSELCPDRLSATKGTGTMVV